MKARTQWLALCSMFFGLAVIFSLKAKSVAAGLPTDFWAGFLLVIGATFAILAVVSLFRRPAASPAL
jgi:hypothetical protein